MTSVSPQTFVITALPSDGEWEVAASSTSDWREAQAVLLGQLDLDGPHLAVPCGEPVQGRVFHFAVHPFG